MIILESSQHQTKNEGVVLQNHEERNEQNPVFPYGQIVSEKEIKKLIKNIPPPP